MSRVIRSGRAFVALLLLAALALAACGDSDDGDSADGQKTYKLAYVGPLTGPNANLGINIRNGAAVAVEEANEAGGDVKFELAEFDTQGSPDQASTLKDRFINDQSIVGVVGPTFSGETRALVPVPAGGRAGHGERVGHRHGPRDDRRHGLPPPGAQRRHPGQGRHRLRHPQAERQERRLHPRQRRLRQGAGGRHEGPAGEGRRDDALNEPIDPKSQDFSAAVNKVRAISPAPTWCSTAATTPRPGG